MDSLIAIDTSSKTNPENHPPSKLRYVAPIVSLLNLSSLTKGQPLNELSTKRPPSTVLCFEVLMSIAIQFIIHFTCVQLVGTMTSLLIDRYEPSYNVPDGPFHRTILNTVTFLMTVLAYINTFVVNYRGRPFMKNLN